ncbi:hypothetical protein GKD74_16545, partial [Faecalibacterium prausnitzii]|nr:hypothetical protein [Faecalibacterium prausnitzii]
PYLLQCGVPFFCRRTPPAHPETPAPQKAPEGTPCAGCPYWKGIGCLFCYREHLKKAGLMCGHLARKNALFARVSSLGF